MGSTVRVAVASPVADGTASPSQVVQASSTAVSIVGGVFGNVNFPVDKDPTVLPVAVVCINKGRKGDGSQRQKVSKVHDVMREDVLCRLERLGIGLSTIFQ